MTSKKENEIMDKAIINAIMQGDYTPDRNSILQRKREQFRRRNRNGQHSKLDANKRVRVDPLEEILGFKYKNHSLRLSCSSIAAMAGFHPYTNLPKLLIDLVYQGFNGQRLLEHDAKLLGISLVSEEENLKVIAAKAGAAVEKAVKQSLEVSKGKKSLKSVDEANTMKENIVKDIKKQSKKLTKAEINQLMDATRYNVNTGFGKDHEENAIDLYEKQCGWKVGCRNEDMKIWRFFKDEKGEVYAKGNAVSLGSRNKDDRTSIQKNESHEIISLDDSDDEDENEGPKGTSESDAIEITSQNTMDNSIKKPLIDPKEQIKAKQQNEGKSFFYIMGVADGIRDEMFLDHSKVSTQTNDDEFGDDNWDLRQVIIEVKHRMKKAFLPPPLYDQIQTVIYCMMYGTTEGELVQVVKSKEKPKSASEDVNQNVTEDSFNKKGGTLEARTEITSSRISLDDEVMQHRRHWSEVVLPRVKSFVEAVYTIRKTDTKRYQLLQTSASLLDDDTEVWNILFTECPWLKDCDISFHRSRT